MKGASQVVLVVKNLSANRGPKRHGFDPGLEEGMATRSSILRGESHGQRSLVGYIVHRAEKSQTQLK